MYEENKDDKRTVEEGYHHETFTMLKRRTIRAAKDLLYDKNTIEKLRAAESEGELERIMRAARHNKK